MVIRMIPVLARFQENHRVQSWLVAAVSRLLAGLAALVLVAAAIRGLWAQSGIPNLSLPDLDIPHTQTTVAVPVTFSPNGAPIAALAMSIDYDPACLYLPMVDSDDNGFPDSVVWGMPPAFQPGFSHNLNDPLGEIDITIIDYTLPLATLPEGTLVTLTFQVLCVPTIAQGSTTTHLLWSTVPSPGMGNDQGQTVNGTWDSGFVRISRPVTPTNTPVPPTVTDTPSVTPETPTVTDTPSVTPEPPTVTDTPSVTPETPTVTDTPSVTPEPPTVTITPPGAPVTAMPPPETATPVGINIPIVRNGP
jgi:hypothetical protein